jgi:hypothetical protein
LEPRTAAYRQAYRERHLPRRYSGPLHLAFTSSAGLAIVAACLLGLRDVSAAEWLVVPLTFLMANGAEYRGHKGLMHRRVRPFTHLFERHTLRHHQFFTDRDMAYDGASDLHVVLFSPIMMFVFLGVIASPIGAAVYFLVSRNAGLLYVATVMAYFLNYEWLHFAYHSSWAGRVPGLRVLRRLHLVHHNKGMMNRACFNITYPLFDWVHGTLGGDRVAGEARDATAPALSPSPRTSARSPAGTSPGSRPGAP